MSESVHDEHIRYYREMLLIRRFEEKVAWMFSRDMIAGTCHLCCGQEACAVGAIAALDDRDPVVSNHRGHGHVLAKGGDPKLLMAELMGKASGYCAGKGGTQHLCVLDAAFLGTNGITGGGIPFATGVAFSSRYREAGEVITCFFGDGASNQGTFHESLNMASIWKLPVVYFCENNAYAMSMHVSCSVAVEDIAIRAQAYGMPGVVVDGMDLLAVRGAMEEAVGRARAGEGPTLIEAKTYRFSGHSKSDRRVYRTREEEERWKDRDPILLWRTHLVQLGVAEDALARVVQQVDQVIEDAVAFASAAAFSPADEAHRGVYA